MVDEKETQEEKGVKETPNTKPEETPVKTEDNGGKYETTPVIERAREERERLEKATAELKTENDRKEQIMAKEALGGKSDGGQKEEEKKEDDPIEYSKKVMLGEENPLATK